MEQDQFNRLQMVQLECPKVRNPCASSTFEDFPFPIFSPCYFIPPGVIRIGLLWEAGSKIGNFLEQNQFDRLQMVQFEYRKVRNLLSSFSPT